MSPVHEVLKNSYPALAVVSAGLLFLALAAVGVAPGFATTSWLALVTPSLVVIDLRLRRLPNVLVVPGLVSVLIDMGWATIARAEVPLPAVLTTVIVTAAMFALNLVGGLGMGDVKLSAVIAGGVSLVSPWLAITSVMLAFLLGGAYSAVLMLRHRGHHGRRIAFGPVMLIAFWAVMVLLALNGHLARSVFG